MTTPTPAKTLRRTSRLPETRSSTPSLPSTTTSSPSTTPSTKKPSPSPLAPAPLNVSKHETPGARVVRDKKRLDIEEQMLRAKTKGGILDAAERAAASLIPASPGPAPVGKLPAVPGKRDKNAV
ncbi:hypothetical protein SLS58_006441 [Diplodia intermedia]|uniref:Uncharacterized protein n=1 Tax=Diplodia intermedia TaxID=856260 RepID=A0ABR3TNM5_9PEZI